jgi:hypothetical protein
MTYSLNNLSSGYGNFYHADYQKEEISRFARKDRHLHSEEGRSGGGATGLCKFRTFAAAAPCRPFGNVVIPSEARNLVLNTLNYSRKEERNQKQILIRTSG